MVKRATAKTAAAQGQATASEVSGQRGASQHQKLSHIPGGSSKEADTTKKDVDALTRKLQEQVALALLQFDELNEGERVDTEEEGEEEEEEPVDQTWTLDYIFKAKRPAAFRPEGSQMRSRKCVRETTFSKRYLGCGSGLGKSGSTSRQRGNPSEEILSGRGNDNPQNDARIGRYKIEQGQRNGRGGKFAPSKP
eukprot:gene1033-251_t